MLATIAIAGGLRRPDHAGPPRARGGVSRLLRCDGGAVSIEFVVLSAGVLLIGIGVGEPLRDGVVDMLTNLNDVLLAHPTAP